MDYQNDRMLLEQEAEYTTLMPRLMPRLTRDVGDTADKDYWAQHEHKIAQRRQVEKIVAYCQGHKRQYHPLRRVMATLGIAWSDAVENMVLMDHRLWSLQIDGQQWRELQLGRIGDSQYLVCWAHTQDREEIERHNQMASVITRKG
jgi:hypothetical protein